MATINTDMLDNINSQLDGIITYINQTETSIQDIANVAGANAQTAVNAAMAELSSQINTKLSAIRTKVISIFNKQYKLATERIAPIQTLMGLFPISISLSTGCLTAIVDALTAVKDIIIAPYQPIIEFTTQVIPKVLLISQKMQTIAGYQPSFDIPGVEVPPLELHVDPITPGDITG